MTASNKKTPPKAAPAAPGRPLMSGLGLEGMGDLSALLDAPVASVRGGAPLELDMSLIDEDPKQPRTAGNPGFSDESLSEMAASIALRGVKTPISVRHNPDAPGRYLINHGARRFRGSKRAGKTAIPGFIDNDYNEADQVVENLQRNELTAREIADYIGRELAKGMKKGDIAKTISKSAAFVTQHVTLLDLPDPIAAAFNAGRVKDVTVVNELVTAFKKKPQEVDAWLSDENQEITRGSVKLLREFLEDKQKQEHSDESEGNENDAEEAAGNNGTAARRDTDSEEKSDRPSHSDRMKKAVLQIRYRNRPARLILNRRPSHPAKAWVKYEDDGQELEANLVDVNLVALLEG